MLVELVLCPVTFTGAAVGSDKKVHETGLEISQGTVWRICIQMLGCKTFITNKTFRKKKVLTILVCSNDNRVTVWSISFRSRCTHCDVVIDVLSKIC